MACAFLRTPWLRGAAANFRGSDGYGLAFRKKGYGEFGGAMIDDIIDGAHFAIAGGIADRDRICSIGASYGGYAALMVALREPGLVKCTISIAGVTDPTAIFGERLKLFDENSSVMRFWESYIGSRYRDRQAVIAASPARRPGKSGCRCCSSTARTI
jgi:Dipeptidyl aminopeptidases/acylaminoacyl-peptidases